MEETCAVCGTALARSDILYAPDGRVVCPKHFAEIDLSAGGTSPPWRISAIAGGIVGAIPFGIHVSSSSMSTVNGHVTSFVYRDWIAVICGVIAMICGVLTVVAARKEQLRRALAFAAGIGVLALGGVQIARGFGVFESPGNYSDNSTSMSVAMFEKGCDIGKDKGSATGCNGAAEQLAGGEGVKRDKKRAAVYAAKACERDATYCKDAKGK